MGKEIRQPIDPRNFGSDISVRPAVQTLGEEGGESQGNRMGGGECQLFLAGNRTVLLGNRRFSCQEIA